ncbi:uncharacterized protein zmp:0000000634 isoform X2 [Lampris incognitus]|uniref:uncharacterized protein zmp:0000000634 isoform X2 n=1 Tax=Lampris incognitus TaxID=2546036 RepID=UPI0024B4F2ED|nr:uncharacterized protein zmp:0000000634 isoform X2 [Lampris incognitus]
MQCLHNTQLLYLLMLLHQLHSSAILRRSREEYLAARMRRRRLYLRRRNALVALMGNIGGLLGSSIDRHIRLRESRHGRVFWSSVLENFGDEQWLCLFRMSRRTFELLVTELEPSLKKQTTNYREPIEPRRRLAVALWWFATACEYRTIASLFGVGISTVCILVREVTAAILRNLYRRFVSLPAGQHLDDTIAGFEQRGYPQCGGVLDGTHIPVIPPRDNPADYCNTKGWHSIILQAVVDHNYCFTDINAGCPGGTHDVQVLASSDLYRVAEVLQDGYLFPREKSRFVNNVEIPVHLISDPAYSLKRWLVNGYSKQQQLTEDQQKFNIRLSSAWMVVEDAFGRLKGRWRCLMKQNDVDLKIMPDIVAACCVLHNLCELNKEQFLSEWNVAPPQGEDEEGDQPDEGQLNEDVQAIRNSILALL